ncbi:MAG: GTP-binding protein [Bryobacterales bacterium]|nr:GTP-binding protein [Bryobacterales bacterium]
MIQKKICLLGAYGVGKTSLVRRFVESLFDESYHTTVGVKIDKKVLQVSGTAVMLMLWDLAGEDEVEQVRLSHLRGAAGFILVVDGCRKSTLLLASALRERVRAAFGELPYVLAVNKSDLLEQWEINPGDRLNGDPGDVFITSAKTGACVEQMFERLAAKMLTDV